jgi:hypothetical protein
MSPISPPKCATPKELLEKVEELLSGLMAAATGGRFDNEEYQRLRTELLANPRVGETTEFYSDLPGHRCLLELHKTHVCSLGRTASISSL